MFGRSHLTHFVAFLVLLGLTVAAELYRVDDRPPVQVKADGGLVAWNPDGTGSVIDHVKNLLGNEDPWVSTTIDYNIAKGGATSPSFKYVYYIDPTGLNPVDTLKEFDEAHQEHPHPGEKEFSVKSRVPWNNIVKWDTFYRSKKTGTTTRADYDRDHPRSKIRSFVA